MTTTTTVRPCTCGHKLDQHSFFLDFTKLALTSTGCDECVCRKFKEAKS